MDNRGRCRWKYVDQSKVKICGLDFAMRVSRRCDDVASRKSVAKKSLASGSQLGSSPRFVLIGFHTAHRRITDDVRISNPPMYDP